MIVEIKIEEVYNKKVSILDYFEIIDFYDKLYFLEQIEMLSEKYELDFWYFDIASEKIFLEVRKVINIMSEDHVTIFFEGVAKGFIREKIKIFNFKDFSKEIEK